MFEFKHNSKKSRRWRTRCSILCFATLGLVNISHAQEDAGFTRGFDLYSNHCVACHTSVVHVSEQRKADSLDTIKAYILRWTAYQNLSWTDEEVADVLVFLNKRYYKF